MDLISFGDNIGNVKEYTSNTNEDMFYRYSENGNDIITDIELYKFNVSGTNPDTTPPTIDSVIFEPSSLNGPGEVTIKIFSSDNESGIQKNHWINVRLFNKEHNIKLNISANFVILLQS